jgi:hypothetical protein
MSIIIINIIIILNLPFNNNLYLPLDKALEPTYFKILNKTLI